MGEKVSAETENCYFLILFYGYFIVIIGSKIRTK